MTGTIEGEINFTSLVGCQNVSLEWREHLSMFLTETLQLMQWILKCNINYQQSFSALPTTLHFYSLKSSELLRKQLT